MTSNFLELIVEPAFSAELLNRNKTGGPLQQILTANLPLDASLPCLSSQRVMVQVRGSMFSIRVNLYFGSLYLVGPGFRPALSQRRRRVNSSLMHVSLTAISRLASTPCP